MTVRAVRRAIVSGQDGGPARAAVITTARFSAQHRFSGQFAVVGAGHPGAGERTACMRVAVEAAFVKQQALELGADMCNIAPVERFGQAPEGFHPRDIFPECRSVVVFLTHFPLSPLACRSLAPYTFARNMMIRKTEDITYALCDRLEQAGVAANPIPCDEPYEYWHEEKKHGRGILSLKHAGMLAGLGVIGKNTLLINNRFGNMMWIGAVLVSAALEGDPLASYDGCLEGCSQCLDACPCEALDGTTITQKACRQTSLSWSPGGGAIYECNTCRTICPNRAGI